MSKCIQPGCDAEGEGYFSGLCDRHWYDGAPESIADQMAALGRYRQKPAGADPELGEIIAAMASEKVSQFDCEMAAMWLQRLTAQRDALLAACQLALKAIDESYEATGFFRVGHTLKERIAIEAAIAACQPTTESEGER